ncbi:MAG: Gfo/Idh/MocA family oxidoreductase [Planctomycetota bacterium]|jgi:predicted dehydrogenase|nr:Gfo/Idh/MocA family oxidoreductase [Planctomycetota bacterium]MDP7254109.1 Gfo/Idh/MocA family oxidoreductase [Planctomycetota bacterium]
MIKFALISGRGMGLMHGRNFNNHSDTEMLAVVEMDEKLLAAASEEFGVPGYTSIAEMLANQAPELVVMIVNETRRIPPLQELLTAGKNVFTEKPLCGLEGQIRVQESDASVAAPAIRQWRESGLKFGIDYNYRFFQHFQMLNRDATEGTLGEIKFVRARAHFNCWSHVIDQIQWTMGRPEWVSAVGDPSEDGPWTRSIRMKWSNGVYGQLDGTNLWGYDDHPLRVMIVGDKAYGEARGLDGWYRRSKANSWPGDVEELWEKEGERAEYEESFVRMADGVVKAMHEDNPFPADGEAAWNELVFEAAVHRSCCNDGAIVKLDDVDADAMSSA